MAGAYARRVPGSIQSIERAAAVLRLLATPPGRLTLAQIVSALHLAKGTAHGIVRTLVEVGFVEQDATTGKYRLGDALLDLGADYLDPNEVRARSMNWADPLAARTGHAVQVGVLASDARAEVLVVHHVYRPDGSPQRLETGARYPAHATALGKVLLAYSPAVAESTGSRLPAFTQRTITDRRAFVAALRDVRTVGHAVDLEEYEHGVAGIAVPIKGNGGLVVAAVAVHGDPAELCNAAKRPRAALVSRLHECAEHIAGELAAVRAAAVATLHVRSPSGRATG